MYTVHAAGAKWYQIIICPTFLEYIMSVRAPSTFSLDPAYWRRVSISAVQKLAQATVYSPIDGMLLADKMFLHEVLLHFSRI